MVTYEQTNEQRASIILCNEFTDKDRIASELDGVVSDGVHPFFIQLRSDAPATGSVKGYYLMVVPYIENKNDKLVSSYQIFQVDSAVKLREDSLLKHDCDVTDVLSYVEELKSKMLHERGKSVADTVQQDNDFESEIELTR